MASARLRFNPYEAGIEEPLRLSNLLLATCPAGLRLEVEPQIIPTCGIPNMGASCFMNASLVAIASMAEMVAEITNLHAVKEHDEEECTLKDYGKDGLEIGPTDTNDYCSLCVAKALRNIFRFTCRPTHKDRETREKQAKAVLRKSGVYAALTALDADRDTFPPERQIKNYATFGDTSQVIAAAFIYLEKASQKGGVFGKQLSHYGLMETERAFGAEACRLFLKDIEMAKEVHDLIYNALARVKMFSESDAENAKVENLALVIQAWGLQNASISDALQYKCLLDMAYEEAFAEAKKEDETTITVRGVIIAKKDIRKKRVRHLLRIIASNYEETLDRELITHSIQNMIASKGKLFEVLLKEAKNEEHFQLREDAHFSGTCRGLRSVLSKLANIVLATPSKRPSPDVLGLSANRRRQILRNHYNAIERSRERAPALCVNDIFRPNNLLDVETIEDFRYVDEDEVGKEASLAFGNEDIVKIHGSFVLAGSDIPLYLCVHVSTTVQREESSFDASKGIVVWKKDRSAHYIYDFLAATSRSQLHYVAAAAEPGMQKAAWYNDATSRSEEVRMKPKLRGSPAVYVDRTAIEVRGGGHSLGPTTRGRLVTATNKGFVPNYFIFRRRLRDVPLGLLVKKARMYAEYVA